MWKSLKWTPTQSGLHVHVKPLAGYQNETKYLQLETAEKKKKGNFFKECLKILLNLY